MKKLIFFFSALMLLATSCAEKEAFTITGKLPSTEYDGQQVYLQVVDSAWKSNVSIDTANIVNGQFVFKGLAKEGATVHFLVLENAPQKMKRPVFVIVEPGNIEVTFDSISTIKGTSMNDAYQAYQDKYGSIRTEIAALNEKSKVDTTAVQKKELEKQFDDKREQIVDATYDFVKDNIGTQVGAFLFSNNYYLLSLDRQKDLLAGIQPKYKTNARIARIEKSVQAQDVTAEGKMFTDVKAQTPEGKDAALSDYAGKGKYVLVDFWASWCGPCRAEMPKLVEMYKEFKGKDFEIVGLSLDRDGEAWKKGIKDLGITWPQISDLKFWDSVFASTYGLSSIPHLMIIDKDGKILARGINADEAKEKLEELLK